jgi:hypothetical protein
LVEAGWKRRKKRRKKMTKLSNRMKAVLKSLAKFDRSFDYYRPTMRALQNRGLVECINLTGSHINRVPVWTLTHDGIEVVREEIKRRIAVQELLVLGGEKDAEKTLDTLDAQLAAVSKRLHK